MAVSTAPVPEQWMACDEKGKLIGPGDTAEGHPALPTFQLLAEMEAASHPKRKLERQRILKRSVTRAIIEASV